MRLKISIKPNASKTEILSQDGDKLKIAVAAPPDKNKANIELVKFLSKRFGSARIVSGFTSRVKVIEIESD